MARAEPNTAVRFCAVSSSSSPRMEAPLDVAMPAGDVRSDNRRSELIRGSIRAASAVRHDCRTGAATSLNYLETQSINKANDRVELSKPIVFGNTARYFGFTRDDGHTHEWTLYVRPYRNSHDLSPYIKKVIFVLEPYYPNEEIFQPPYEIRHTGWGEFDIDMKLVFRHRTMRALTLRHYLRLVEYDGPDQTPIYTNHMQSESYDEIVISLPPAKFKALLRDEPVPCTRCGSMTAHQSGPASSDTEGQEALSIDRQQSQSNEAHLIDDEHNALDHHAARRQNELTNILEGKKKVLEEIHRVKDQLLKSHQEIRTLRALIESHSAKSTTD